MKALLWTLAFVFVLLFVVVIGLVVAGAIYEAVVTRNGDALLGVISFGVPITLITVGTWMDS